MERTRIVSILVASLVGGALVVAIPVPAAAQMEKLPVAQYARMVCGPMGEAKRADDAIAQRWAQGPMAANFGPTQEAALDFVMGYQKIWADAAAMLGKMSPQVTEGEKIGKAFADYANSAAAEIQKAIDAFKAVDPNNRFAFMGALNTFGYAGP